jgi:hypothetical protein
LDEIAIMRQEIAIIPSYNIDSGKWNRCIDGSSNALVYANSWYLDHLADNWSGIILGDYQQVMPVIWRKKYGVRYSYQAPFVQQLGIYGEGPPGNEQLFVGALHSFCRYGDYPFNYRNFAGEKGNHINYVLKLDKPNEIIAGRFSDNAARSIRRAELQGFSYEPGNTEEAISCFQTLYGHTGVPTIQFDRLRKLCFLLGECDKLIVRRVLAKDRSLLATALLIRHGSRMYNLMNNTPPVGRKAEANYYLLSQIWKEFERSGLTFDFEGSDLPGVREFYKKFGGHNEPYFKLHLNHLPWPMRLFKK